MEELTNKYFLSHSSSYTHWVSTTIKRLGLLTLKEVSIWKEDVGEEKRERETEKEYKVAAHQIATSSSQSWATLIPNVDPYQVQTIQPIFSCSCSSPGSLPRVVASATATPQALSDIHAYTPLTF